MIFITWHLKSNIYYIIYSLSQLPPAEREKSGVRPCPLLILIILSVRYPRTLKSSHSHRNYTVVMHVTVPIIQDLYEPRFPLLTYRLPF